MLAKAVEKKMNRLYQFMTLCAFMLAGGAGAPSVIAAGAIVLPGTKVEPGSIYGGIPARKLKEIGPEMREVIARTARNYPMYATWYEGQ